MVFLACLFQVFFLEPSINFISLVVTDELLSFVQLFVTPWTVASQASLSMGFLRQEYRSWVLLPSPGDLPDPGIEPTFPALTGGFFTAEPPGKSIISLVPVSLF